VRPPSVDVLARSLADSGLPHPLLVGVARATIAEDHPNLETLHAAAQRNANDLASTLLQPVINATGVLLHTNMGRSPGAGVQPSDSAGVRYSNLEFDLSTGGRGSRHAHAAALFARLVDAEAAIIVNNCAAAVTLTLAALAAGRGVAVSRSELVEIGGGFRVPDVMEQSGATLVEVGTTNRTRLADFRTVIEDDAKDVVMALQVHQSNYKIVGFTESVSTQALSQLDVPVVADIGSGLVDAACPWLPDGPPSWLVDEPAARQTLSQGADLVTFSADKLLGGTQAGIIAGRADLVEKCRRHPLNRAFRPGGLVLASLQELALTYLERQGDDIPFWRLATLPLPQLQARAEAMAATVGTGAVVAEMASVPGGGTLPSVEIPSVGIRIESDITAGLRLGGATPVIARVHEGHTHLDMRTIDPADDAYVAELVRQTLADSAGNATA